MIAMEIDAMHAPAVVDRLDAVIYGGAEFHRRRGTCRLVVEFEGYPCNDYRCTACGKVHNAPRANGYCPRCGAKVEEVVYAD